MANFSITPGMGQGEIIGAINYLLANIGTGLQVNGGTGQVTIPNSVPNTVPYAWAYRYLYIAFADSFDGTQGFTQFGYSGKTYIGFWNTNTETLGGSLNPLQYIWYKLQYPFVSGQLLYKVNSQYQFEFLTDADPDFNVNSGNVPPYVWRPYQGFNSSQVGVDLTYLTNATTLEYGTLASPPNLIYGQYPAGSIPDFIPEGNVAAGYLQTGLEAEDPGTYPVGFFGHSTTTSAEYLIESVGPTGLTFNWTDGSSNNTLNVPNLLSNKVVTILPQSVAPTNITTGTITTANRVNWDPAGLGINSAYPVFYDGTTWEAMYRPPIYGSFNSTATFSVTTATNSYVFTYNNTDFEQGIKIVSTATSRIQLDGAGVYNLQFSAQCANSAAGVHNAYIWLRQNGTDVANSAGDITIPAKHGAIDGSLITSWNFFIQTNTVNEYVEIAYGAEDVAVSFPTYAAGTGPTRPASPAIIVTVNKVS